MVQKVMPSFEPVVGSRRQRRRRMKYYTAAGASAATGTTKTKTACCTHHVNSVNVLAQIIFLSTTIILTISNLSSQIKITVHAEPHSNTIPRSNNRYTNYNNHGQTSSTTSTSKSSSPLSDLSSPQKPDQTYTPPWNPSPKIDSHGFLSDIYSRTPGEWEDIANIRGKHGPRNKTKYTKLLSVPVRIRQVPGDGNCLFHSIASCLHYVTTTSSGSSSADTADDDRCHGHLPMDSFECFNQLRQKSLALRNSAVDVLANESSGGRRKLFLQGEEYLEARELLSAAAAQFDLEGEEYCELMRKESYWGGGPEIVALCNYLQRPIHIYELIPAEEASNSQSTDTPPFNNNDSPSFLANNMKISKQFTLRRMACFGSPKFDRREPLHILSADSRFPDIEPRRIRKVGNHFLALFPVTANDVALKGDKGGGGLSDLMGNKFRRHALIRGGSRVQQDGSKCGHGSSSAGREASTNGGVNKRRGKDYSSGNDNEVSEKVLGRWDGGMGRWRTRHFVDWFV